MSREINHKLHEYEREMDTQTRLSKTYETGIAKSEKLLVRLRQEFERGIAGSDDINSTIRSIYDMRRKRMESMSKFYLARAGFETMIDLEH